jgi:hypothetical protein
MEKKECIKKTMLSRTGDNMFCEINANYVITSSHELGFSFVRYKGNGIVQDLYTKNIFELIEHQKIIPLSNVWWEFCEKFEGLSNLTFVEDESKEDIASLYALSDKLRSDDFTITKIKEN